MRLALETTARSCFAADQDALRAQPLRAWREAEACTIAARIHTAHAAWSQRWGQPPVAQHEVTVCEAQAMPARQWCVLANDQLYAPDSKALHTVLQDLFRRALFGDEGAEFGAGALADSVAHEAGTDWLAAMSQLLGADAVVDPIDTAAHAFDGRLAVRIATAHGELSLCLGASCVARLLSPMKSHADNVERADKPSPVVSVLDALHKQPLALGAYLTEARLTLGELQGLQPGDVIVLSHALAEPLQLRLPDGSVLGRAWLGRYHGRKAICALAADSPVTS